MGILSRGKRKARKSHQCFHCYRSIGYGETYEFQTLKYDYVYTLKYHTDCESAAWHFINLVWYQEYGEGYPPLRDMMVEDEYKLNIEWMRGRYPHVVCRMELTDQLRENKNPRT